MRKHLINLILLAVAIAVGITYGFAIHKYKVFPYDHLASAYRRFVPKQDAPPENPYGPFSIGIYEGPSPFDLTDAKDISNPVLTAKDVVDIDARFVADPFVLFKNGKYTMFFEALNRKTNQGDIGYAESSDALHWSYGKIVLDETFHLSYPYVFEWNNDYYLIPESYQDLSVRLYKAISFPDRWEYIGNLISGYRYVDPSVVRYNDKWWLFVSTTENDVLNLYYSKELLKGWQPHPLNPIVKFNKNIARPGGRIITYQGKPYRLTQDDDPTYGEQVFAFEISELTEESYLEKIVSEKPIVGKSGKGWNAAGMHHIDPIKLGDKWIAVVDGKDR